MAQFSAADGRRSARQGTVADGWPVRFRTDGKPPLPDHGADIDDQGNGTVSGPRPYQLIRQASPITDRRFGIEFLDPARRSSRSPAAEHGSAAWKAPTRGRTGIRRTHRGAMARGLMPWRPLRSRRARETADQRRTPSA